MKLFFRLTLLFAVFYSMGSGAQSTSEILKDPEYRRMLERLNEKYQDYFSHQQQEKRFQTQRKSGAQQAKAERAKEERAYEKARIQYIRQRKADPDPTPLRRAWEAEQRREEQAYERARKAYVLKRQRIEMVEKSARKIPEEIESGLVPSF